MDILTQLSATLADRVAAAALSVVALRLGERTRAGILWRADLVVASEQTIGDRDSVVVAQAGSESAVTTTVTTTGTLAGRDPGTNIAVFRLATPLPGALPAPAEPPRVGSLALILGANAGGAATSRLAMVHETGPAWHALAGGRIDSLIRLDARLGADEGGPVLDAAGLFLGLSTSGPHGRVLVIPAATIERIAGALLEHGHIPRGWLGVGLHPVAISESLHAIAGQQRGSMVLSVVAGAPAEAAGVMAGDILLEIDGSKFGQRRRLVTILGMERIGQTVAVRLLRAGEVKTVTLTIAAR